jgi:superfamily II DNA or RNA helicase
MPVNALEETLSYIIGFEIQLKPEQRKSIINLLRHGEDAGYRVLPTGYGKV